MLWIKLSAKYWTKHAKRLFTLAVITIMGAAALCVMALFMRSKKEQILNTELDLLGNYDAVFYDIDADDMKLIADYEGVEASGCYRELGYTGADGNATYKVVSFPDAQSEALYHMSCTQGTYPQQDDEIVVDANAAKELGVAPVPGQKVRLTMYDLNKQEISTGEYTISGIVKASDSAVYGGYYRYPNYMEQYDVPAVFVKDTLASAFGSSTVTAYIQTDEAAETLASEIAGQAFTQAPEWDAVGSRTYAYSYIMGIIDHLLDVPIEMTVQNLMQAVKEGNVWKDFYSSVFMPLFAALLFIIIVVSLFSLVRSLLLDRAEEISILRSLGMEKGSVFLYLLIEFFVMITVFTVFGMLLGSGLHDLMIRMINLRYGVHMPYGFSVSRYVSAVTLSPWLYTILVMELSCMVAVVIPLYKMIRVTPIAVAEHRFVRRHIGKQKHLTDFRKCTWKKLIGQHVHFHDITVLIITGVVMCTCFFGYNYFHAMADRNNMTYQSELRQAGLEQWDYHASKTKMAVPYEFKVENHHDYGIEPKTIEKLAADPDIGRAFARMVNQSTRLSYTAAEDILPACLDMRKYKASEDTFENALHEAEDAMMQDVGYDTGEAIYSLPTVGVRQVDLDDLKPYIKEGSIHSEAIAKGEEVILVIPDRMAEQVLSQLHAGDSLPLSDIVLSEKEESYHFSAFSPAEQGIKPSYKKNVIEPESGSEVPLTSYAVGHRKNIDTKIGAIAVLDDVEMLKRYTLQISDDISGDIPADYMYQDDDSDESGVVYGISAVCLPETFAGWGLPDHLFTEAEFAVADHVDLADVNHKWYEVLASANGISFQSSYEIKEKMRQETGNIMAICYLMVWMLVFIGIVAIGIKFYSRIQIQAQTIAKLRAIGMPVSWLEQMIIRQNLIYPAIGAVLAVIPVSLCQIFFLFMQQQVDSGAWSSMSETGEIAWWFYVPYRYSLFDYHPVAVLLLLTAGMLLLTILATLPQILYLKRQSIADTINMNTY